MEKGATCNEFGDLSEKHRGLDLNTSNTCLRSSPSAYAGLAGDATPPAAMMPRKTSGYSGELGSTTITASPCLPRKKPSNRDFTLAEELEVVGLLLLLVLLVLLFFLLVAKPPPMLLPVLDAADNCVLVMEGKFDLGSEPWMLIFYDAKEEIQKLLDMDPAKRLTAAQILALND
eukprot:jgi/Mesen1/3512/ME000197S02534